ncbi:helix-turn-helix transcriptional regulator [Thiomonas sp. FB-Cd]|uniref:helix-turn-helix domain-containing protein n=1 Tax=Thiomonas sp. FB-Cd TaxID=1158292 RepID=UPI0004DF5383|nr:helix-turn-helix transcriptional regulator [Thiomonas sp. FB-Cd]
MAKIASKKVTVGTDPQGEVTSETPRFSDAWSGTVDEKQLKRPGGVLMAALVRCAAERGQSISQLAEKLGYSYPYINLLMSGLRKVDQISDDFAGACAVYLRVPRLTVLMMAGRLKPDDFFEMGRFGARMLEPAMQYIANDPQWSGLLTAQLRSASAQSKYCVVKMYEQATGRKLLADELNAEDVVSQMAAMRAQKASEDAAPKKCRHQV